jgi:hypothetical protein
VNIDLVDLAVAALAGGALTELARHDPRLEDWRARLAVGPLWLKQLSGCGFCLSHWAALAAIGLIAPKCLSGWGPWCGLPYLCAVWLAAVRLSNLVNDLTHAYHRSPRRGDHIESNA